MCSLVWGDALCKCAEWIITVIIRLAEQQKLAVKSNVSNTVWIYSLKYLSIVVISWHQCGHTCQKKIGNPWRDPCRGLHRGRLGPAAQNDCQGTHAHKHTCTHKSWHLARSWHQVSYAVCLWVQISLLWFLPRSHHPLQISAPLTIQLCHLEKKEDMEAKTKKWPFKGKWIIRGTFRNKQIRRKKKKKK